MDPNDNFLTAVGALVGKYPWLSVSTTVGVIIFLGGIYWAIFKFRAERIADEHNAAIENLNTALKSRDIEVKNVRSAIENLNTVIKTRDAEIDTLNERIKFKDEQKEVTDALLKAAQAQIAELKRLPHDAPEFAITTNRALDAVSVAQQANSDPDFAQSFGKEAAESGQSIDSLIEQAIKNLRAAGWNAFGYPKSTDKTKQ